MGKPKEQEKEEIFQNISLYFEKKMSGLHYFIPLGPKNIFCEVTATFKH